MEGVLPVLESSGERDLPAPKLDLVYRKDVLPDGLSAGELEVLGSHLPELVIELLQLTYEADRSG